MQPVPPDNKSAKGPGKDPNEARDLRNKHRQDAHNVEEAGDRANIEQNTSNQRSG